MKRSDRRPSSVSIPFWAHVGMTIAVVAFVAFSACPCGADVDGAVTWLLDNQSGDSYWGDADGVRLQYSATVVEVLRRLGVGGSEVSSGEAWLANSHIRNNDDAARILTALEDPPFDLSEVMSDLLESQHAGAGWGLTGEYRSDPLDTGLAIRGLVAQGSGDGLAVQSAVSYLLSVQNVDGGWGVSPTGDSNIFITSIVLLALEEQSAQDASTEIGDGVAWLSAQANPDNGFGAGGTSSVSETAQAYLAIIGHDPGSAVAASALVWLTEEQDVNGSWNDSAYETALGAWALAASGPDLFALDEEISFVPPNPIEGQNVTITVPVHNGGLVSASDVTVSFFNGSPSLGDVNLDDSAYTIADVVYTISILLGTATPTQEQLDASDVNLDGQPATVADVVFMINVLLGKQVPLGGHIDDDVLADVPAGGSANTSVIFNTSGHPGNNMIFAEIDPPDVIAESNETNNTASALLVVSPTMLASGQSSDVSGAGRETRIGQLPQHLRLPAGSVVVDVRVRTQEPLGGVVMRFRAGDGVEFGEPSCGELATDLGIFSQVDGSHLHGVLVSFEGLSTGTGEGVLLKIPLSVSTANSRFTLVDGSFSTADGHLTAVGQIQLELERLGPSLQEGETTGSEASGEGRVSP